MKTFQCEDCGERSYSSAELEHQYHPECPVCKSENMKEVTE